MTDLPDEAQRRVSDADRAQVSVELREAAAEGRITFEELDARLAASLSATTASELALATRDLGPPVKSPPSSRWCLAIMTGTRRAGSWSLPSVCRVVAIFGGIELDLREARFSSSRIKLKVRSLVGHVEIVVPEGVSIEVRGNGLLGSFDHVAREATGAAPPTLQVTGFVLIGSVKLRQENRPDQGQ